MKNQASHRLDATSAFTRLDLLAIIVIVGVLSLLATAAKATGEASSETITCVQNHKQLIRAWQLYAEDNDGRVASNMGGTSATITNWVGGVLSFSVSDMNWSTNYVLDPRYASMGPYVKKAEFFRCPSDLSKITIQGISRPRIRSYSMNAAIGRTDNFFLPAAQYRLYNRLSDFVNPRPQSHFVFIDEHPDSINACDFYSQASTDTRSAQWIDLPAAFHNQSATVSFVDGHVEVKQWQSASTLVPVRYNGLPTQPPVAAGDSRDYLWVAERTSAVRSN